MLKPATKTRFNRALRSLPALYSGCFLLLALVTLWIFHRSGRTFLWVSDGAYQHYIAFSRLCDYLKALPSGGLPAFDFSLGQGADVFTTLGPYSLTDPVNVFCALLFPLSRLARYSLMIFIKLWLIGLSFLLFCRWGQKGEKPAVLAGALLYTFSGAVLFTFARHPIHIGWAYHFPLLCGAVELYRRKGKGLPLILIVFSSVLSSYYTTYINGILLFFYIVITGLYDVIARPAPGRLRKELLSLIKMFGLAVCGLLMASFILLPTVYAYAHNARLGSVGGYMASSLHYPLSYYRQLFYSFFAAHFEPGDYYTFTGMSGLLLLPLAVIFTRRKGDGRLRLLFAFSFLLILIPLAGRLLNGMSYASNRFCYVIPFYASLILVSLWDTLREMKGKQWILPVGLSLLYLALCLFLIRRDGMHIRLYFSVFLAVFLLCASLLAFRFRLPHPLIWMGGLALISCAAQLVLTFHPRFGNYVSDYLKGEDYHAVFENSSSFAAKGLSEDFYRVEQQEALTNIEGFAGVNGTSTYWSLTEARVVSHLLSLGVDDNWAGTFSYGLDKREGLAALADVRYYTRKEGEENAFMHGYSEIKTSPEGNVVYENQFALPLAYAYKECLSLEELERLDALDKEQAMLEAAVLEKLPADYPRHSFRSVKKLLDAKVIEETGVSLEKDRLICNDYENSLGWEVQVPEKSILYLMVRGIRLEPQTEYVLWELMRQQGEERVFATTNVTSSTYSWPVEREDLVIRLGALPAGTSRVSLRFINPGPHLGVHHFDSMAFYAVPAEEYERAVLNLAEEGLKDIQWEKDVVKGRIDLKDKAILQFSIPFSGGWEAEVDGKKAELQPSDIMYMALPLTAGSHEIVLKYHTPYLLPGVILSLISTGGVAAACFCKGRGRKATPPPECANCESQPPESGH